METSLFCIKYMRLITLLQPCQYMTAAAFWQQIPAWKVQQVGHGNIFNSQPRTRASWMQLGKGEKTKQKTDSTQIKSD